MTALEALTIAPSSWSTTEAFSREEENTVATSRYLTSVLSNSFDWLQDPTSEKSRGLLAEEQKEFLWDLASQRLSERCGRSGESVHYAICLGANRVVAQGEISRTWKIAETDDHPDLNIVIREPPLVSMHQLNS